MHGRFVDGGMHTNRGNPHFTASADNPQGNLSTIGDKYFFNHGLFNDDQNFIEFNWLLIGDSNVGHFTSVRGRN